MKPCHAWLICSFLAFGGCAAPALRSQSPEQLSDVLESKTRLIGEVARPFGHMHVQVESVAMVTGLDGTGGDPAPSPQRTASGTSPVEPTTPPISTSVRMRVRMAGCWSRALGCWIWGP